MDYKEKYNRLLDAIKELQKANPSDDGIQNWINDNVPELKESEDEQHRKWILEYLYDGLRKSDEQFKDQFKSAIAWLKEQGQVKESPIPQHENKTCEENSNSLTSEEDERIRKEIKQLIQCMHDADPRKGRWLAWLEKQGEKSSNILHDMNEEPEEQREIFCEWGSNDAIWHDVVFYHADTKTFWNGEQRIEGVVKWAYIDEMLEKQGSPVLSNSSNIGKNEQKIAKNIVETWKDMRLEVYQQASGNRHEPNYSDDTTKLFSLNDIDEIMEKMSELWARLN